MVSSPKIGAMGSCGMSSPSISFLRPFLNDFQTAGTKKEMLGPNRLLTAITCGSTVCVFRSWSTLWAEKKSKLRKLESFTFPLLVKRFACPQQIEAISTSTLFFYLFSFKKWNRFYNLRPAGTRLKKRKRKKRVEFLSRRNTHDGTVPKKERNDRSILSIRPFKVVSILPFPQRKRTAGWTQLTADHSSDHY